MATTNTAAHTVIESEYDETLEWGFRADIRVRITNPTGDDVVAVRTFKARPKYDDLTGDPDHIHEFIAYCEPDAYPANGDQPFTTASTDWKPGADIDDDEALFKMCLTAATMDAQAELDSLDR